MSHSSNLLAVLVGSSPADVLIDQPCCVVFISTGGTIVVSFVLIGYQLSSILINCFNFWFPPLPMFCFNCITYKCLCFFLSFVHGCKCSVNGFVPRSTKGLGPSAPLSFSPLSRSLSLSLSLTLSLFLPLLSLSLSPFLPPSLPSLSLFLPLPLPVPSVFFLCVFPLSRPIYRPIAFVLSQWSQPLRLCQYVSNMSLFYISVSIHKLCILMSRHQRTHLNHTPRSCWTLCEHDHGKVVETILYSDHWTYRLGCAYHSTIQMFHLYNRINIIYLTLAFTRVVFSGSDLCWVVNS